MVYTCDRFGCPYRSNNLLHVINHRRFCKMNHVQIHVRKETSVGSASFINVSYGSEKSEYEKAAGIDGGNDSNAEEELNKF